VILEFVRREQTNEVLSLVVVMYKSDHCKRYVHYCSYQLIVFQGEFGQKHEWSKPYITIALMGAILLAIRHGI